jgi:lipopolysaccharide transport system ATP-binding protein
MKAALLGLSSRELAQRLDDILEFADIGDYIHEPVKHYSSGMVVRLGFAVVAASNPELLITDEVLAVGDESFQKKCIRWIEGFLADGNTLLMVSHSMYLVQKLCHQALWLHEGRAREVGDVFPVTQSYLAWHEEKNSSERRQRRRLQGEAGLYRVNRFRLSGQPAGEDLVIPAGGSLEAEIDLESPDGRPPVALVGILRADGTPVYGVSSDDAGARAVQLADGLFRYRIRFDELGLLPGSYSVRGHAMDPEGMRLCDTSELRFVVSGESRAMGIVYLPHKWNP